MQRSACDYYIPPYLLCISISNRLIFLSGEKWNQKNGGSKVFLFFPCRKSFDWLLARFYKWKRCNEVSSGNDNSRYLRARSKNKYNSRNGNVIQFPLLISRNLNFKRTIFKGRYRYASINTLNFVLQIFPFSHFLFHLIEIILHCK